ncbi:MAG: hypothetical protein V3T20_09330 [Gemmatimonadota bacterium]
MSETVLQGVREPFRALVVGFVPEAANLSAEAWEEGEALAEGMLAGRPAALQRQVRLLIRSLDVLSLLLRGHRLARLDSEVRTRLLASLQDSRLLNLRRGVWGLRTLAFVIYYGRDEGRTAVGYRASPGGWIARAAERSGEATTPGSSGSGDTHGADT